MSSVSFGRFMVRNDVIHGIRCKYTEVIQTDHGHINELEVITRFSGKSVANVRLAVYPQLYLTKNNI